MSERVSNQGYWIGANLANDPEMAELTLGALVAGGGYGAITVQDEGRAKLVIGPVSTLVLPNEDAVATFMVALEGLAGDV